MLPLLAVSSRRLKVIIFVRLLITFSYVIEYVVDGFSKHYEYHYCGPSMVERGPLRTC